MPTMADMFRLLTSNMEKYQPTAMESLRRNSHKNDASGAGISEIEINAMLSGFIEYIKEHIETVPVKKIDLLTMLTENAKGYRNLAAQVVEKCLGTKAAEGESERALVRKDGIDQRDVDAILTDYINFVGYNMCVDYALYAADLRVPTVLKDGKDLHVFSK